MSVCACACIVECYIHGRTSVCSLFWGTKSAKAQSSLGVVKWGHSRGAVCGRRNARGKSQAEQGYG